MLASPHRLENRLLRVRAKTLEKQPKVNAKPPMTHLRSLLNLKEFRRELSRLA